MLLTNRVKNWLVKNEFVEASSEDDQFRKAAGEAIASGELTTEKLIELTTTKEDKEADEFTTLMKSLGEAVGELKTALLEDNEEEIELDDEKDEEEVGTKAKKKKKPAPVMEDEEEEDEEEKEEKPKKKSVELIKTKSKPSNLERLITRMGGTPDDDEEKEFSVRVKEAAESYSSTKSAMTYPSHTQKGRVHPWAGRPVLDYGEKGRQIDNPSDLDKAIAGAYGKFAVAHAVKKSRNFAYLSLPQHDKELLHYAMENSKWGGVGPVGDPKKDYADIVNRKLTPSHLKALIDDSTSGGLEAAPIVFDDQVIQTPLLHGELFPLVNSIPLDRGRRVEGVATGTVTGSWGGVDDTAIDLFDTTAYVTAFDTTIFRWQGAVRVGLDFLSDTPIDFGAHLTTQYGERLLEDLDDVIATGNGTTQPEGVMVKSGTTSVAWGGTSSIGNYESLRFGVAKPEHRANLKATAVFCGTETSYQRAKAIPVGASDARRLSNTTNMPNYDDYSWMDRPYKINESLSNEQIFYAILGRYRLYRRRGLTMRTSTEGDTLIRRNEMLLVATARYGGQLERGATAAVTSTAPA